MEESAHRLLADVAAPDQPLVIGLDRKHRVEPDEAGVVGEDADHVGAARDLAVEALERIRASQLRPVLGRRTDVVGIFPDDASLIRLVSMLAIEANDEWLVGRSYISQKSMATLSDPRPERNPPLEQDKEVELIAA